MTRVKICGLTSGSDLEAVVDAGADAIGVITEVPVDTPREVDPARAADLVARAPPFVTTTLVLMPDSIGRAVELVETVRPDAVQLHGSYDPEELRFVRAETGAKVLPVVDCGDHDRAAAYAEVADAVVVDSTNEEGAGGTGETHDWAATGDLAADLPAPVALAGGLTPDNVGEAIRTANPYAVDVASGVEADGGVKDRDAVREFVRNTRRTDAADAEDTEEVSA
jgi:phosphoribosylanthranilate isomerase